MSLLKQLQKQMHDHLIDIVNDVILPKEGLECLVFNILDELGITKTLISWDDEQTIKRLIEESVEQINNELQKKLSKEFEDYFGAVRG